MEGSMHQDATDETASPVGETPSSNGGALEEQVLESLKNVIDPELGINIVDLGLVYDVAVEDGTLRVEYTLTTMGCPIGPLIESQMQQTISGIEGVDGFEAEMVFTPPWTPDKMSEEAKAALGMI
jgi:metal-sulfur cluster biosynthetic enzyme